MDIIKIERPNLVEEVKNQMTNLIQSAVWREGEKLASENQLAKDFNVSRVVIREALQNLRSQNMIITKQGLGSFVSNPNNFSYMQEGGVMNISERDFDCLTHLRKVVEFCAMDIVAISATSKDFKPIEQALERMKLGENSVDDYSIADLDFHMAIVQASGVRLLIKAMAGIREEFYYALHEMNAVRDTAKFGIDTHKKILLHLKNHDAESAKVTFSTINDYNQARYSPLFKKK